MRYALSLVLVAGLATAASAVEPYMFSGSAEFVPGTYTANGDIVYDNGLPSGVNGVSAVQGIGLDRRVVDDFSLSGAVALNGAAARYVWNSGGVGLASAVEVEIYADAGGVPALAPMAAYVTSDFTETATGGVFFSRPEVAFDAKFEPTSLAAGTYWVGVRPYGEDNAFWLVSNDGATTRGSEVYVDYPDLGFPRWTPGAAVFGAAYDVSFTLQAVPEPASLALLGLGAVAVMRRRR